MLSNFASCVTGDEKWLLVSTDQLYHMAHSGNQATHSRCHYKSRLPSTVSSGATSETIQCEVAFPGNRILSPSPADNGQPKPECVFDMHRTDVNSDLSSHDKSQISDKVLTQPISELHDANTTTADSSSADSLTLKHSQLSENCKVAERADNKSVDSCGIYMENNDHDAVPLEPMKAEKLATFGNVVLVIVCYYLTNNAQ